MPKLLILYGSETGNAQDFAETLALNCKYHRYEPTVAAMDDFPPKGLLDYHVLIVICSTAGQGELPLNSRHFWKFLLRKKLPSDLLSHIKFSTFGLGDSSYSRYNWAVRKIHARLLQLGAREFSPRGECDDQSAEGPEAYYAAWSELILKNLPALYPGNDKLTEQPIDEDVVLAPSFRIEIQTNKFKKLTDTELKQIAFNRASICNGGSLDQFEVTQNDRLTSDDHFQDVRKVVLRRKDGMPLKYSPGDTIALYPTNDARSVDALIKLQGWDDIADYPIKIETVTGSGRQVSIPGGLIKKLTLRSFITHHLDIMSVPRRSFFMQIRHFVSDEREKEKLIEFCSLEEAQQLYDYADRPRRSILEVVQEFFSLKIPVEYLLDVFPLIKPRLFSISSRNDNVQLELTIAIVEYKTIIRRLRRGLCTRWIKTLVCGDNIVGAIKYNRTKYGLDNLAPIVLAYTGTGVAPVKNFVETELAKKQHRLMYVFSGNRYPEKDYLYGDLWKEWEEKGQITVYRTFSRDPEYAKKGYHYIYDRLYKEKQLVNDLLVKQGGVFYLCGSSGKMPTQVRITMEMIFGEENAWNKAEAKEYLSKMESSNRYIQDTW
ncbi:hypothetical protein FOA43_002372 [Brettanomyces nanus]|uniref:NADPH-dependent diflavin oxidoreductase 1 n=1 Tax=Eeniella nana TaxID=13502 RepID=A0A875S4P4_EENNA|nr:uncharacterized protein FOA43_002372 [Brettanomyces nanus]QPG75032.1 hypothetical protein FOA43_002372 [Brettanomyces nanus]